MSSETPQRKRIAPRGVQEKARASQKAESPPKKATTAQLRARQAKSPPKIPSYLPPESKTRDIQSNDVKTESLLNDAECIEMRNSIFESGSFVDYNNDQLDKLCLHLREYSADCASKREYQEASKANSLASAIKEDMSCRGVVSCSERSCSSADDMMKQLESDQKKELDEYDSITESKRNELNQKQEEESEKFEAHWHDTMPHRYQKPSSKLIELLGIEHHLSLSQKYDEAADVKARAEKLEEKEMEQAQKQLLRDYNKAKKAFERNQASEREQFESTRKHWREVMEARHQTEKSNLENRANVLKIRQSESAKQPRASSKMMQTRSKPIASGSTVSMKRKPLGDEGEKYLLPSLVPPNDDQMKEELEKKKRTQKERNKQIKENLYKREHAASDLSSIASDTSSSSSDSSVMQPVDGGDTFPLTQAEQYQS